MDTNVEKAPAKTKSGNGQNAKPKADKKKTGKYALSSTITLVKENPHRPGSQDHKRFASLKDGMSVEDALKSAANVRQTDLTYWVSKGQIKVVKGE